MTKLVLSTGNVVSDGPSFIRKPGAYRSNLELTNSLRSNFLAAQQDYPETVYLSLNGHGRGANDNNNGSSNGSGNGHSNGNGNGIDMGIDVDVPRNGNANGRINGKHGHHQIHAALPSWTAVDENGVVFVPRIEWTGAGLQEEREQYDITAKLFFLPTAAVAQRAEYARAALDLVLRELGVPDVDLLVVSFPGMSFAADCEWEADKLNAAQGDDEEEFATWPAVEALCRAGRVRALGIAEFGSEKLARLLQRVQIRPVVDQINVRNCCNVPPPLARLAKEQRIELLTHSDCTDVLPKGTLRELLGPRPRGAGILAEPANGTDGAYNGAGVGVGVGDGCCGGEGLRGDLTPQWVVKYTAVVRDRGVIENKGYFAGAELVEA